MDLTARQAEISDLLRQEEFLTVESLADKFNVTTQTVRRDIKCLIKYVLLVFIIIFHEYS